MCFVFEPVGCFDLKFNQCSIGSFGAACFVFEFRLLRFRAGVLCASVLMAYECFVCRTCHKKHLAKIYRRRIRKVNDVGLLFWVCFKFNLNVKKKLVVNNLVWP